MIWWYLKWRQQMELRQVVHTGCKGTQKTNNLFIYTDLNTKQGDPIYWKPQIASTFPLSLPFIEANTDHRPLNVSLLVMCSISLEAQHLKEPRSITAFSKTSYCTSNKVLVCCMLHMSSSWMKILSHSLSLSTPPHPHPPHPPPPLSLSLSLSLREKVRNTMVHLLYLTMINIIWHSITK